MQLSLDLKWADENFRLNVSDTFTLTGVTALFGPSGAGKTSVLKAIAGFSPDVGIVSCDGVKWQDSLARARLVPAYQRPVATVFQNSRLFPHLTVHQNLQFAIKRANQDGPNIAFDQVVDALDLSDVMAQSATTLSGGEAQRVAIARALLTRPQLILMDEPLSGIDRSRKNVILRMIADLPEKFDVPVIFVSHLVEEVAHISDQLIAMQNGEIVGVGPTVAMLEKLGADVTGHFETGSILEGDVVEWNEALSMIGLDVKAGILWMPSALTVQKGERLRVRLRARDVSIALGPLSGVSIRNQLPARIIAIDEETGPFAELRLDCAGQTIRVRLTRMAVKDLGLAPDMTVFALVKSVAFDRRLGSVLSA